MSEEPRRSVRSTKGFHSHKEQEIEGNVDQAKKKPAKKGASKKAAEPSPEPEANEDGDIIRCVCGATTQDQDEEGEEWIACEQCTTWQHNVCMGIQTENVEQIPDYYCEVCRPQNHKELLASKKRGEELWKTRREEYNEEKKARKNRKGKGGSAKKKKAESKPATPAAQRSNGQVKESPAASVREESVSLKKEKARPEKRKGREESQDQDAGKIKQRKISETSAVASPTVTNPSAMVSPPHSEQQQVPTQATPADAPQTIDDLKDNVRENLAKHLQKNVEAAFNKASEKGHFKASADNSIEQSALRLTLELERAIHGSYPKDPYVAHCKLVGANLKRNQELFAKLLSGELSAQQLAVMSEEDMKSSRQRREDEEELARAERQAIMVNDNGPRVRRTHKGEELVEDNYGTSGELSTREQRDPNYNMAMRSRENSYDEMMTDAPPPVENPVPSRQPLNINTQAGTHERKQSQVSDFDYSKIVSKLPTPTNAHTHLPVRRYSGPAPVARDALDDPDVDRLLEDAPESPPYSPKEDTDPSVVWSGFVEMTGVGSFDAHAKHVGGADLNDSPSSSYMNVLGKKMSVTGRIEPDKANEYLCRLRYSPGSDMVIISVAPRCEGGAKDFKAVFEYFSHKVRFGVVGCRMGPSSVRDIYLVPLEAGNVPLPIFMSQLEVNKIPENREARSILIVMVLRDGQPQVGGQVGGLDGSQSPSLMATMTYPQRQMSQIAGPAVSPLTHQGSFKSPDPTEEQVAEDQRRGEALAREILGPELMNSATLTFILPQAGLMVAKEWHVIRNIYMNDVKARTDLQHLAQLLADRANAGDDQQQTNDAGVSPSVRA